MLRRISPTSRRTPPLRSVSALSTLARKVMPQGAGGSARISVSLSRKARGDKLTFALEPSFSQTDLQMLRVRNDEQARTAIAEGNPAEVDPIAEQLEMRVLRLIEHGHP